MKQTLKIDDSLDVFAVHAVGGMLGCLLVAFLGLGTFQGLMGDYSWVSQLGIQLTGIIAVVIWSAVASFVIMKIAQATVGIRVTEQEEAEGLDITSHGERGYEL